MRETILACPDLPSLCENRGIGIDPSYLAERVQEENVTFIQDF